MKNWELLVFGLQESALGASVGRPFHEQGCEQSLGSLSTLPLALPLSLSLSLSLSLTLERETHKAMFGCSTLRAFGPELAMESRFALACSRTKDSSANFGP